MIRSLRVRSRRRLLPVLGLSAALLALPGVAAGDGGSELRIHGAGVSLLTDDTRRLTVEATGDEQAAEAGGAVQFTHLGPAGVSRFRGAIDCVRIGEDGTVQLSGRVLDGLTAAGVVLDGRDYAFTVRTAGDQAFSLPRFGEPGSIEPCSGGRPETVSVDHGRYVAISPSS